MGQGLAITDGAAGLSLAAISPDWIVFGAVLVLFPAFGAAVFFWWRRQYGVWSKRRQRRPGDFDPGVVFVPGAWDPGAGARAKTGGGGDAARPGDAGHQVDHAHHGPSTPHAHGGHDAHHGDGHADDGGGGGGGSGDGGGGGGGGD